MMHCPLCDPEQMETPLRHLHQTSALPYLSQAMDEAASNAMPLEDHEQTVFVMGQYPVWSFLLVYHSSATMGTSAGRVAAWNRLSSRSLRPWAMQES